MTDTEIFLQIFKTIDSTVALALAVWVITVGVKRLDIVQKSYADNVSAVLKQQHEDNNALITLVKELHTEDMQRKMLPKSAGSPPG